jgi:hypothetical protein
MEKRMNYKKSNAYTLQRWEVSAPQVPEVPYPVPVKQLVAFDSLIRFAYYLKKKFK